MFRDCRPRRCVRDRGIGEYRDGLHFWYGLLVTGYPLILGGELFDAILTNAFYSEK